MRLHQLVKIPRKIVFLAIVVDVHKKLVFGFVKIVTFV